ncbi:MAG: aspartate-semialdehyde dehydrogenase [Pseudomonadota bacterium]
MRWALLCTSACALAACDAGVPPPGQEPLRASKPQVSADEVVLRGQGLIAGPEAFYFSAGRNEVETALEPILGEPVERNQNAECGTGEMEFTEYTGGFIVNFQRGNLVGWNSTDKLGATRVVGDVQIGTSREEAQAADGFAEIPTSTLGDEFALGDAMGGFFEGDSVVMLYAGAQCFFR